MLRVGTLKGARHPLDAARHNKRELPDPKRCIDATRSHLNYSLRGPATASEVADLAQSLVDASGQRYRRKDAVRAHELVLSLSHDFAGNARAFFEHGVAWLESYFAVPVLSADVHLDESARHCHVLLLPLRDGQLLGARMMPGPPDFPQFRETFGEAVAKPYGLRFGSGPLSRAAKRNAAAMVLNALNDMEDAALRSLLWPVVRDCIERDPGPCLEQLGLTPPVALSPKPRRAKTFVDIMTGPGKGPKWEPPT